MGIEFDEGRSVLQGEAGGFAFPADDAVIRKLAMLIEGECEGLGAVGASARFGYSRARYYQLRATCRDGGVVALAAGKRGPHTD